MQQPIDILERYWNFTRFRSSQEAIINAVIAGEDVMTLMPTGGGKSLCFQIPALVKDGICIVISPLVALMKNQVQSLSEKGIKAIALTSGLSYEQLDSSLDNCIYGNYKFLYVSPERLQQELVQDRIQKMNVNLIAVDEAHCISQWGHDFRPSYRQIKHLRQLHPHVNCIALTASATPHIVKDIIRELDYINPKVFKQSFLRENLAYMVLHEEDKLYRLETILKKYKAPSIIYVRNRKSTLEIAQWLNKKEVRSTYYHGGLSHAEKDTNLQDWLQDRMQVMVATNAFGMGIDKPDVKTVIHLNLPESIESYFQETGRAGRNGEQAFAVILKNRNDDTLVKQQFLNRLPTVDFVKQVYRKLSNYFQISYGEGTYTTHNFNFNHFCKTYKFNTITTYNALQFLDRMSVINLSKEFNRQTHIQFKVSNNHLFTYLEKHQLIALVVKSILRTYGGVFDQTTKINTVLIANKASVQEPFVLKVLAQLEQDNIITLSASKTDAKITFIQPREDDKTINVIAHVLEQQNTLKQNQVSSVLNYVNNDSECKSVQLLKYFEEENTAPCGICSVCISRNNSKKKDYTQIKNDIVRLLELNELSSRELSEQLQYTDATIHEVLQLLLEHQKIIITKTNTYKLVHI